VRRRKKLVWITSDCLAGNLFRSSRDSRGHTVTAVYVAEAAGTPVAADDAKNCRLFKLNELPESLAFDHAQVLADYKKIPGNRSSSKAT